MAKLLSPDRTGVCVCGVLVADHFDKRNVMLPCEKVQNLRRPVATANVTTPRLYLIKSDRS